MPNANRRSDDGGAESGMLKLGIGDHVGWFLRSIQALAVTLSIILLRKTTLKLREDFRSLTECIQEVDKVSASKLLSAQLPRVRLKSASPPSGRNRPSLRFISSVLRSTQQHHQEECPMRTLYCGLSLDRVEANRPHRRIALLLHGTAS